jgi:phosphohistidine phosphatase
VLEVLHAHGSEDRILVIGHDPAFSQVVHDFTGARIEFKKGGVAGLRTSGELIVLLRPRELEAIAG